MFKSSRAPRSVRSAMLSAILAALLGLTTLLATPAGAQEVPPPVAPEPDPAAPPSDEGLGESDLEFIEEAQAAGEETVTLLIAAEPDQLASAVQQVESLGGEVEATDAAVDYLKVEIPTEQADDAARLSAVAAVDVDGIIHARRPAP